MSKPEAEKMELTSCVLYTLYDEFGKEVKVTQWSSESLGDAYALIQDFANKFNLFVAKPVVRNTEPDPNAETRTPLDDNGEPIKEDVGHHKPGDKGYWHVKNLELSRLKEGKVKVTMTGVIGQDEKPAEFPFLAQNQPLNMAIHMLDIIRPVVKEEGYFDQPHDEPVDWKVEYVYGNKLNEKGYYFKNVVGITEWSA